jgi:outer membrane biosynthesis protein TonB
MRKNKAQRRQPVKNNKRPFFDKQSAEEGHPFFASDSAVQAKLTIGKANDPLEKEADATAKQVVGQQVQKAAQKEEEKTMQKAEKKEEEKPAQTKRKVQRQAEKKEEEPVQAKLDIQRQNKEEEKKPVQTKLQPDIQASAEKQTTAAEAEATNSFETLLSQQKGRGFALPDDLRSEMEKKFDTSFKQVRIHTDTEAAKLCEQVHALAFTHSYDIYFNEGQYNPNSSSGKELLAHELTHIVQQNG